MSLLIYLFFLLFFSVNSCCVLGLNLKQLRDNWSAILTKYKLFCLFVCHLKTSLWCHKLQPLERTTALVALNVARKVYSM